MADDSFSRTNYVPPPPVGPPPSDEFDVIMNGQCTSLSVMFTRLVLMLRDPTLSLSGMNDSLSTDIISPCALTYEIFGKMVRAALEKLETRELGSIKGVRVLQSMLNNMKSELEAGACAEETIHERQALALIERAVCEASGVVNEVVKKLLYTSGELSAPKRQRCEMSMQGEIEGVVVAALPAMLRILIWLMHAATNSAGVKCDDDQTRRVLDDLRGLVLSLEISKTSLKSMIDMNEQLVAGFTRQMMLAERLDQSRESSEQKVAAELNATRVVLAKVRAELKATKRLLCIPTFMVTDVDGRVCEWGELAHHVTGIAKITDRFVDIRSLFCETGYVDETLCTLKCAGQNDPDVVAIRVHLHTVREDMEVAEKKAFVSLKAVVSERDQEGCVKKILWIGEDLTRERDELVQDKADLGTAGKELVALKTEIAELRAKLSESEAGNVKVCQDLADAEKANERLVQELGKFRQFTSGLDSLKTNLGIE
jgi:hypothetical protein